MSKERLGQWARAKRVLDEFGIGRSTLRRLVLEGRIESKVIKSAGATKGIRLFSIESIKQLLATSIK